VATAAYTDGNAWSASAMAAAVSFTANSSLAVTGRVVGRTHSALSMVPAPVMLRTKIGCLRQSRYSIHFHRIGVCRCPSKQHSATEGHGDSKILHKIQLLLYVCYVPSIDRFRRSSCAALDRIFENVRTSASFLQAYQ